MGDASLAAAAREYVEAGLHILALTGKRPSARYHESWDWENSIHGAPGTPEEEAELAAIFEHRTTTGIALLIPQHVLVADIDSEAAAALYMEAAGEYPETPTAKTKNGLHVWFWVPGAERSIWLGQRTLLFKGFGGYVVAPPSQHFDEDGNPDAVYTWINPLVEGGRIKDMDGPPDALEERMRTLMLFEDREPPDMRGEDERWSIGIATNPLRLWRKWNIDGLCRTIEEAADGNQNNAIHWAAMTAREEGVPFEEAMRQLLAAAIRGHHPERRARTTIAGAYKRRPRG